MRLGPCFNGVGRWGVVIYYIYGPDLRSDRWMSITDLRTVPTVITVPGLRIIEYKQLCLKDSV